MVESGMVAAGYTLLSTVCTGWQPRDPVTHELQENLTAWPGGMKSFAEYVHSKGMQLQVYTDAGTHNCCGDSGGGAEPGSLGFEYIDMKTFASWGADAVGVDYCGGPKDVKAAYQVFADAIVQSGRDMQLGVWNLGDGAAYQWVPTMSKNMTAHSLNQPGVTRGSWAPHMRLTRDIGNIWAGVGGPTESVLSTMDQIQGISDLWSYGMGNRTGTFPNYGQLVVGVPPGHPSSIDTGLSLIEAQSHFSLWSMFASLLYATNDVRKRDSAIERILLNNESIAINQDPWTLPASRLKNVSCNGDQWVRHLSNGDVALLVLNRDTNATTARVDFGEFGGGLYRVRDVQGQKDLGEACGHTKALVLQSHQTAFFRLTKLSSSCTPGIPPACTAPRPPPAPPPPPPPPQCPRGPCKSCADGKKPCPFPVPSLPPCPDGFIEHPSGYWSNPDQKSATNTNVTVTTCGAMCKTHLGCVGFEVYDPDFVTEPPSGTGSCCYTYTHGKLELPFISDARGLIRTCVAKQRVAGALVSMIRS